MEASTSALPANGAAAAVVASRLVGKVADLMWTFKTAGVPLINNPTLLTDLCFSLAKGIDHSVANNAVPLRSRELPVLLKQVYESTDDISVSVALMILSMSIRSACSLQWFSPQDTVDLLKLTEKVLKSFSDTESISIEPRFAAYSVLQVMSRFYPKMKMEQMLLYLELKPGYRAYVADFHIIRGMVDPKQDKICLLVARLDNMNSSSCLVTPPEASFMLNGQEVTGRTIMSMVRGPQLPTDVTEILKYGVNCLQAVGLFDGDFLLVIAVMSTVTTPDAQHWQNYVRYAALTKSESVMIETPASMSLNCPISKSRMRIPVKGKFCKHPQCFDYDNFLEINSRRPLWKCAYCKQSVCYLDLRIDQNVLKVLREAAEKVVDVIVSSNGSWREIEDHSSQKGKLDNHEFLSCTTKGTSISLQDHNPSALAAGSSLPDQTISLAFDKQADGRTQVTTFSQESKLSSTNNKQLQQIASRTISSKSKQTASYTDFLQDVSDLNSRRVSTMDASSMEQQPPIDLSGACYSAIRSIFMQKDPNDSTSTAAAGKGSAARPNSIKVTSSRTKGGLYFAVMPEEEPSRIINEAALIMSQNTNHPVDAAGGNAMEWRPSGRMRGSLTGEAYSAAYQQFITTTRPTVQSNYSQLPSNFRPTPSPASTSAKASNSVFVSDPSPSTVPSGS